MNEICQSCVKPITFPGDIRRVEFRVAGGVTRDWVMCKTCAGQLQELVLSFMGELPPEGGIDPVEAEKIKATRGHPWILKSKPEEEEPAVEPPWPVVAGDGTEQVPTGLKDGQYVEAMKVAFTSFNIDTTAYEALAHLTQAFGNTGMLEGMGAYAREQGWIGPVEFDAGTLPFDDPPLQEEDDPNVEELVEPTWNPPTIYGTDREAGITDLFVLTHFDYETEITKIVGVCESKDDAEAAEKRTGWSDGFSITQCQLGQVRVWKGW